MIPVPAEVLGYLQMSLRDIVWPQRRTNSASASGVRIPGVCGKREQNSRYDRHNGLTAAWQRAARRPFPWPALSLCWLFLCPLLFKIPVGSCTIWTSQGRGSGSFQGAPITPLLRHSTPRRSR